MILADSDERKRVEKEMKREKKMKKKKNHCRPGALIVLGGKISSALINLQNRNFVVLYLEIFIILFFFLFLFDFITKIDLILIPYSKKIW